MATFIPTYTTTSSMAQLIQCNFTYRTPVIHCAIFLPRSSPSRVVYFIVPQSLATTWATKTILLPYGHHAGEGSPMYNFSLLLFTFLGNGSLFSFARWTTPPPMISLITYGPNQSIWNFLGNFVNLISYSNTKSSTLNVCRLICWSCDAFLHSFCTCWWNLARK